MNILMAASEMVPFAKTGGLGDVLGSLPKALSEVGETVSTVIPLFRMVDRSRHSLEPFGPVQSLPVGDERKEFRFLKARDGRVDAYFVECDEYYDREEIYGTQEGDYPDNARRFMLFAHAVPLLARMLDPVPDIIHCNDWQTGLVPAYVEEYPEFRDALGQTATLYTIHNLGYQGIFPAEDFVYANLNDSLFDTGGALEFWGQLNLMKSGIVYSSAINTVSHKYAEEILTPEIGFGLEGTLRENENKLFGILNGVDYDLWDPATDKLLPANYSGGDMSGKVRCKKALQQELGLETGESKALFGMVTRLVEQKGLDLLLEAIDEIMAPVDVQFVILGKGEERYESALAGIEDRWPGRYRFVVGHDERLSHLIEAGADFFLMPSRYEPCGLNQIYSLKYGTIPIVRATGGLDDTVVDAREDPHRGNGFKFHEYSTTAFLETAREAYGWWKSGSADWYRVIERAFKADFSWDVSARRYQEVYRCALGWKTGAIPRDHKPVIY